MISFMVKYKTILLIATIAFFVGSLGFVGAGVFMEEYGPNAGLAYVGKTKIKVRDFETAYRHAERAQRERAAEAEEEDEQNAAKKLRQEVLQDMITRESMVQSAGKYGLGVSDLEVGYDIKSSFSENGLFNKKAYTWVVRNQLGMTPVQYEDMVRRQKLADKFQNILILSAKVPPQEAELMMPKPEPAKKGAKAEEKPNADAAALMLMQIKAQSLADSYTRQFNEQERVELKRYDSVDF